MGRASRAAGALLVVLACVPAAVHAQIVGPLPANDLQPLVGLTGGVTPSFVVVQHNPEPVLRPVPRAHCGPGSRPLAGVQGRVPASAVDGTTGFYALRLARRVWPRPGA
jgi:hypothetical protein